MRKILLILAIGILLYSCKKECNGTKTAELKNTVITAWTYGEIQVVLRYGCPATRLIVNQKEVLTTNASDRSATYIVNKNDKWMLETPCSDVSVDVSFQEICE